MRERAFPHSSAVRSSRFCEFDQQVEPGVVYAPDQTLTLKALDRALYDELRVTVATYDPAFTDAGPAPVRGTGPAVKLVERPDETPAAPGSARHEEWDAATVQVTAENTADFQVTGARLKGKVGDTVPLVVKFTNAGPGWVLREIGAGATRVHIKVPAGTSVAKTDGFCESVGSRTYECGTSEAWVDENSGEASTGAGPVLPLAAAAAGAVVLGTGAVLVVRRRAGRRR